MKSFLFKFVVLIVLVGVGANFVIQKQTGKSPLQTWWVHFAHEHGIKTDGLSTDQLMSSAKKIVDGDGAQSAEKVKIYKWVDAKGVVHYENKPVKNAQEMDVDPNANVLPAAPAAPIIETPKPKAQAADEQEKSLREAKRKYMDKMTQ